MATQTQFRRGTAAQNDSFTGAIGEITIDTTNKQLRLHDGATAGGEVIGGSDTPVLPEQVSAPSTGAGEGVIYTKDTGGQPELFFREEGDGDEVQITSSGAVKIPFAAEVNMVAAGATDVAVSPGRMAFHPGMPKCVVKLDLLNTATPSLNPATGNLLGELDATRNAQGDHTLSWTVSASNIVVQITNESNATTAPRISSIRDDGIGSTSLRIITQDLAGDPVDPESMLVTIFADI